VIGLDTNILVRYFAQDDVKQCALVNRCIDGLSKATPGFVSTVTLCELVWVLEEVYAVEKPALLGVLRQLLESDQLVIEHKPAAWGAVSEFSKSSLDFGDAMIAQLGKKSGCEYTLTFDKRAAKTPEFQLLK
jgi:predicted nucleic-acid-binding protein